MKKARTNELKNILEIYESDFNADRENRKMAIESMEFRAGCQWDELERLEREAEGRPTITINQTGKFINQITGDLRQNRPSIIVKPDGFGSDDEKARIVNGIIRKIQLRARAEEPFINAVDNSAVAGIGHFRVVTEYLPDNPFEQELSIKVMMNPLSVVWDSNSVRPDRSDAGHCFVMSSMSRRSFKKKYPKATAMSFDSLDDIAASWYPTKDDIVIAEYFYIEEETTTFVRTTQGQIFDLNRLSPMMEYREDHGVMMDIVGNVYPVQDIKEAKVPRVKWKKITGNEVLKTGEWVTSQIPIIPVVAAEQVFEQKVVRESLVHLMKEPSRLYNYWRSAQTEIVAKMPKSPYLVGQSQLEGFEEEWANLNKGDDAFLPYKDTGANKTPPQRQQPPSMSTGFHNEVMMAQEDMKNVTGVYDAALGNRSNETSGVAIGKRQAESDVATSLYSFRLEGAFHRAGRILIDAIPVVYDVSRTLKIVHADETDEQVEINRVVAEDGYYRIYNDITYGKYDLTVDIGPSYASQQEQALDMLKSLIGNDGEAIRAMLDILIKMAGVPHSEELIKRVRKILPPGLVEGDDKENDEVTPEQMAKEEAIQKAQELDDRQREAEVRKTEAEADKASAEADNEAADTMLKKMEIAEAGGQLPPGATEIMRTFLEEGPERQQPAPPPQPVNPLAEAIPSQAVN